MGNQPPQMDLASFMINILYAVVMGIAIGIERQYRQHPAGLRTNVLVCVGAALFVSVSKLLGPDASPTRITSQVVSGVGFLGGGVILREGLNIRGMNTAATLWCSAAVGCLAGAGFGLYGVCGTSLIIALHLALRPVSRWIDHRLRTATDVDTAYQIQVVCRAEQEAVIRNVLMRHINSKHDMRIQGIATKDSADAGMTTVVADVFSQVSDDRAMEDLLSRLNIEPGVKGVSWGKT